MAIWMIFQSKRTRIFSLTTVIFFVVILSFPSFLVAGETSTLEANEDSIIPVRNDIDKFDTLSDIDYSAFWNRTYGGFDDDRVYDFTICSEGGYALVGYTDSFTGGDKDIWVIRTDYDGNVIWTSYFGNTSFDDTGYSIAECENGDFIIGGYSATGITRDARIDRLDKDGNLLWTNLVGLAGTDDMFIDIIETSTESIMVVGQTSSWGAGGTDLLAVCLDANGNEIWMRTYGGGSEDHSYSIVECDEGGFAIVGCTMSFGAGNYDVWLLRLDTNGDHLWNCTYGGSNSDQGLDFVQNIFGGFVLAGQSRSYGDASGDFWIISVDSNGNEIWNTTYANAGPDHVAGIVECVRGGYAVIGTIDYISGFDATKLIRIDSDGTELWSGKYYGTNVVDCDAIVEVNPEEFAIAGYTNSFGAGSFDAWLALIPGEPQLVDPPTEQHFEFGNSPVIVLPVESSAPIHMWWLSDTSVFDIVAVGDEAHVYTLTPPDVGVYEVQVHVNNTAGHEIIHNFWIYVDDLTTPHWVNPLENHTIEYGDQFRYTPSADDLSVLGNWSLTGSDDFAIDTNGGEITNVGTPSVGDYYLEVSIEDIYSNTLTGDVHIVVQDTTAPEWDEAPVDQSLNYSSQFVYNLNASDLAGISMWWVDSTEFSVDAEGRVRNLITLAPGEHTVTVYVSDINENILQGEFTVTVGSALSIGGLPSIYDNIMPFAIGVVATLAVASIVCVGGRRKKPAK